jgi:hypothetical protein
MASGQWLAACAGSLESAASRKLPATGLSGELLATQVYNFLFFPSRQLS